MRLKRLSTSLTAVLAATFMAVSIFAPIVSTAQNLASRTIDKLSYNNEPVRITNVKLKGVPVTLGKSFLSGEDWLEGLEFTVENISGRPIQYLDIGVTIPITDNWWANIPLRYGQLPSDDPPSGDVIEGQSIPSDGKINFSVPAGVYKIVRERVEKIKKAPVSRVVIEIQFVYFNSTEGWHLGYTLRPDPDVKGGWIRDKSVSNSSNCPKSHLESGGVFRSIAFKPDICSFCRKSLLRSFNVPCCASPDKKSQCLAKEDTLVDDRTGCLKLITQEDYCFCNPDSICAHSLAKQCDTPNPN